jgi:hypothetical protein
MIGRMECWLLVVGVKQGKGGSSVKAGAPHVKHIPVTQQTVFVSVATRTPSL